MKPTTESATVTATAPPVPPHIAAIRRPVDRLMTYYLIKAALTTFGFPFVLPVLYFRYRTMRYVFDAEGIRMSWGILFRHEVILNYSRIQDIHLESTWVERLLGLARIQIQTAAGNAKAEMTLEGLTDHEAMRDFLYLRMRGGTSSPAEKNRHAETEEGELAGTLHEIAAELRAIRTLIEQQQVEQQPKERQHD